MKALVIYDSNYGNTEKIAKVIAKELGNGACAKRVSDNGGIEAEKPDLVVVGSPILGWRPSHKIEKFLNNLKDDSLLGVKVAAFDTRVKAWYSGDAAKKIGKCLERAGGEMVIEPEFFIVKGKEGPLADGEEERAKNWTEAIKLKL
ncbi:MAG: flavodoxin family protein [Patescibacteria group bacterium]|jgi:flavodoxin